MGNLVFQATLGGQVNLVGPNTASTYNINVPAVAGTMVTTGDTGSVSSTMLASSLSLTTPNINVATGTSLKVTSGFYSTSSSSFTYTDGIVMDYTTGLGRISVGTSDGLAFYNAGVATTELMRLDSSGNLGIGTSSPLGDLTVTRSDAAELVLQATGTGGNAWFVQTGNNASTINGALRFYDYNAGAERMRIDSSGNVGIGTSSPSYKLDVTSSVRFGAGTGQAVAFINGANSGSNNGAAVYFQNAGTTNFAVGNYSAIAGGAYSSDALYYLGSANSHIWSVSGSEKMRIDTSGNLLVGTTAAGTWTSNSWGAQVSSGFTVTGHANGTSSGTAFSYFDYNGSAIGSITQNGTTAVAYNTSSDYRLKNTVAPMTGALAKVQQLKPCTYKWNADGSDGEGFIAHELAEVCPHAVTGEKDAVDADGNPVYQGIDTSFLVATLTAAIQEQQAIIQQLQADVEALKAPK